MAWKAYSIQWATSKDRHKWDNIIGQNSLNEITADGLHRMSECAETWESWLPHNILNNATMLGKFMSANNTINEYKQGNKSCLQLVVSISGIHYYYPCDEYCSMLAYQGLVWPELSTNKSLRLASCFIGKCLMKNTEARHKMILFRIYNSDIDGIGSYSMYTYTWKWIDPSFFFWEHNHQLEYLTNGRSARLVNEASLTKTLSNIHRSLIRCFQ